MSPVPRTAYDFVAGILRKCAVHVVAQGYIYVGIPYRKICLAIIGRSIVLLTIMAHENNLNIVLEAEVSTPWL